MAWLPSFALLSMHSPGRKRCSVPRVRLIARTLPPIAFRIAIAYGEMHTTDDDVYGAVVNVAARLQELAPPGGIALTKTARDGLPDERRLRDLGLRSP